MSAGGTPVPALLGAPWVIADVVDDVVAVGGRAIRITCGHCQAHITLAPRIELLALVDVGRQFQRSHMRCAEPPRK